MKKIHSGFTLIELLVVVLILGLLAAIAEPMFVRSVEESRASEAVTNLGAFAYAQERFHMQWGSYSDTPTNLDMAFADLTYFTITEFGRRMTMQRKINAGGNLGKWTMTMILPEAPLKEPYKWECTPMPACKYLMPSAQVGGQEISANH